MRKYLFLPALLPAVCLFLSGCIVQDWYHDIVYRNAPLPTKPIAPPVKPDPGEYTDAQAVNYIADNLLFLFATMSENGKPEVHYTASATGADDGMGERLYRELLDSGAIVKTAGTASSCLLFSVRTDNQWNVTLEEQKTRKVLFNRTLKLKNGKDGKALP